MDQASLGSGDGGMDGGIALGSTSQALSTPSSCGNTAGLANAPWPMRSGCPTHVKNAEIGPLTSNIRWSFDTFADARASAVIAADGHLVMGGDGGIVRKINASTGSVLGQLTVGGAIKSSPAILSDSTVIVSSESGKLSAINYGAFTLKWTFPATGSLGALTGSPAVLPDASIAIGSADKSVYLVGANGLQRWKYTTTGAVISSPAVSADGSLLYIGSADTYLYALNTSNGTLKWRTKLAAKVDASPTVSKGRVFIAAADKAYALDALTGAILWQRSLGSGTVYSPAVSESGPVLFGVKFTFSGGSMMALSPSDGTQLWRFDTLGGVETTAIIDKFGSSYFGDNAGTMNAVDAAGQVIFKHTLPNGLLAGIKSSAVISSTGGLIFGGDDNWIYSMGAARTVVPNGGTCNADADCEPGLLCGVGNGARFGKPTGANACWVPSCENKVKDPSETEVDCGGPCGSCTSICSQACMLGTQVTPPALEVLSFAQGAFTRGSIGTYQTGANALAVARGDQLRYEDRGDGNGRVALFEGPRTNRVVWSEAMGNSPSWWTGVAQTPTMTLTEDAAVSPAGTTTADRWQAQAGGNAARAQTIINAMPAGSLSTWLRLTNPASFNPASPLKTRTVLTDLTGGWYNEVLDWTLPAAWERRSMVTTPATKSTAVQMSHKGAWPGNATQFPALPAADFVVWGWQLEEGKFPSSYIPTQESALTRKVDRLVFTASDVPAWVRTGIWQIDVFPLHSSAEIATTDEFVLMAWEGGHISLGKDATGGIIKVVRGTTISKRTIGWARNTKLTLTVNATARTLQVLGASTGDGTLAYGTTAVGTGRVSLGALLDGTKSAFARVSELRRVTATSVACIPDPDCVRCGDGIVSGTEACDTADDARCSSDCTAVRGVVRCDDDGDCASYPGRVCGQDNGERHGLEPGSRVCEPAVCGLDPDSSCGDLGEACGYCQCLPTCDSKRCGDDPADGCGGLCTGLCGFNEPNCRTDSDCGSGQVCGVGEGVRFGAPLGTNACWNPTCEDEATRRARCGVGGECGLCDLECVPACSNKACGQGDGCGGLCVGSQGACSAGAFCTALGECLSLAIPKARDINLATTAVGLPGGDYGVSSNGTAVYTIPIKVPPGSGGLTPELALSYDSASRGGILGEGWSLGGLSSITRCSATPREAGYSEPVRMRSSDRFCLDGQLLVATRGTNGADNTQYRTRIDSFQKIVSHSPLGVDAGPQGFTVYTKDGRILHFGGTRASVTFDGAKSIRRAWYLRRITTRAGIEIQYNYDRESRQRPSSSGAASATQEIYPTSIEYGRKETRDTDGLAQTLFRKTGFVIRFTYRDRDDPFTGYVQGVKARSARLLESVSTSYLGEYEVRDYKIAYGRFSDGKSKLASVQECAGSGLSKTCREPTVFQYDMDTPLKVFRDFYPFGPYATAGGPPAVPETSRLHAIDANGDGLSDVAYVGADLRWNLSLADKERPGTLKAPIRLSAASAPESKTLRELATAASMRLYVQGQPIAGLLRPHIDDFDQDGAQEVLEFYASPNSFKIHRFSGTDSTTTNHPVDIGSRTFHSTWTLDADHDGDPDVFACLASPSVLEEDTDYQVRWWRNDGTRYTHTEAVEVPGCTLSAVADMTGEGALDLILHASRSTSAQVVSVARNGGLVSTHLSRDDSDGPLVGMGKVLRMQPLDVNDDRLMDLLVWERGEKAAKVLLNTGLNGAVRPAHASPWLKTAKALQAGGFFRLDFDQDGRDDVGIYDQSSGRVYAYRAGVDDTRSYEQCPASTEVEGSCNRVAGKVECTGCPAAPQRCFVEECCDVRDDLYCQYKIDRARKEGARATVDPNNAYRACIDAYCDQPKYLCPKAEARLACLEHNRSVDADGGETLSTRIDIGEWRQVLTGDVDGDGVDDLITLSESGQVLTFPAWRRLPHALTRITKKATSDGRSVTIGIDYGGSDEAYSLTDGGCIEGAARCLPRLPWPVVTSTNLVSSTQNVFRTYRYENAHVDSLAGWLGFGATRVELRDPDDSGRILRTHVTMRSQSTTHQESVEGVRYYPFANLATLEFTEWVQDGSSLTNNVDVMYREGRFTAYATSISFGGRDFIYPSQTTKFGQSGSDSRARIDWTTTVTPDPYGNYDLIVTEFPEERRVRRVDPVFNPSDQEVADWIVNLPDSVTTTETAASPVPRTVTQERSFTYYPVSYHLHTSTLSPNNLAQKLSTSFGYDEWGNTTSITSTDGDAGTPDRLTSIQFDPYGVWPTQTINAEGHTELTEYYYAHGALAYTQNPNGTNVSYEVDGFGRLRSERMREAPNVEVGELRTLYDWRGTAEDTSESGVTVRSHFEVVETAPNGSIRSTAFNEMGDVVRYRTGDAQGTGTVREEFVYDRLGRLARAYRPHLPGAIGTGNDQGYQEWVYDGVNRTVAEFGADRTVSRWQYAGGEVSVVATPPGVQRWPRHVVQYSNPKSQVETSFRDGENRVLASIDRAGGVVTIQYGVLGAPVSLVDAANNVTTMKVDNLGRREEVSDPDTGAHSFRYDGFGQRVQHIQNGRLVGYGYDRIGRRISRTAPNDEAIWTWDIGANGIGKLYAYETDEHRREFTYTGPFGTVDEITDVQETSFGPQTLVTVLTRHPLTLQVDTLTYPSGYSTRNNYGPTGRLLSVHDVSQNRELWRAESFYQGLMLSGERFHNGVRGTHGYERLTGLKHSATLQRPNTAFFQRNIYGYDDSRNMDRHERLGKSTLNYIYDSLDRLEAVVAGEGPGANLLEDFGFDISGNVTRSALGTYSYVRRPGDPLYQHAQPHAVRTAGQNSYGYDVHGNQVWRSGADVEYGLQELGYDALDRLTAVKSGAGGLGGQPLTETVFAYDAESNLISERSGNEQTLLVEGLYQKKFSSGVTTEEIHRVYAEDRVVAEVRRDAAGTLRTTYIHADHLGSAQFVSDAAGNPSEQATYSAFGVRSGGATQTELGYTGHRDLSSLGLVHAGGRIYDPQLARFLSADPYVESGLSSQHLNRYSYVANNPINFVDPSGFFRLSYTGTSSTPVSCQDATECKKVGDLEDPENPVSPFVDEIADFTGDPPQSNEGRPGAPPAPEPPPAPPPGPPPDDAGEGGGGGGSLGSPQGAAPNRGNFAPPRFRPSSPGHSPLHSDGPSELSDPNNQGNNKVGALPLIIPVVCAAGACEAVGTVLLYAAGAAVGIVGGTIIGQTMNDMLSLSKDGTPRTNQAQNKQFGDAVKEIQKAIGRSLGKDEVRQLHDEISGNDLGFHDIVDIGTEMFGDSAEADE